MPIPEPFIGVVQRLAAGTDGRQLRWQMVPNGDFYFVAFKDISIAIGVSPARVDSNGRHPSGVFVRLLDAAGVPIDGFTIDEADPDFERVMQLCQQARRQAKKIDERIALATQELDRAIGAVSK